MDAQEVRDLIAKNQTLEENLTKKNQQYIFDLKKALDLANLPEEKKAVALSEMLPQLVEGQKSGQTARQLFGKVSERVDDIIREPIVTKEMGAKEMWLDNSLLLFSFLGLMTGLMPLFSKNKTVEGTGILTIIVAAITGGYAFYLLYKWVYQYDRPGADKSQRPGMVKSLLTITGVILAWMLVFMLSAFIPRAINVVLTPYVMLVLAALVFGIRFIIRKKFGITGNMFMR